MISVAVVLALICLLVLLFGVLLGYRKQVGEARIRENEAKLKLAELEERNSALAKELKVVSEEKGRFQNEATRVDEMKSTLLVKESQIQTLQTRISDLEREKTGAIKDAEAADLRAAALIEKEKEASAKIIKAKDEQIAKQNEFISEARGVLTTEFKALSADALKNATAQLLKTADDVIGRHEGKTVIDVQLRQEQIAKMLTPVEQSLERLDKEVKNSNLARESAQTLLQEQVNRLAGASESLTNALRKPVIRGSWGEMTLENALENAGLEPGIDFILQHSTDAEDGLRRTDAVINLPKGRKLVVDSKNLMETYLVLANAQNDADKAILTEAHSRSLRRHIKALSAKEYWRRYEGLDCVILFIPHDGMYHAAIQDESELIRDASDKRVFISNPMTLMPLLKAVRFVLDQERLNKNAEEIKNVGEDLYGELARFAGNMATIGDKLRSTVDAYNRSIPGLDRFILAKSRKLKQLGSWKGAEAELPDAVDVEPRLFTSQELRPANHLDNHEGDPAEEPSLLALAAEGDDEHAL